MSGLSCAATNWPIQKRRDVNIRECLKPSDLVEVAQVADLRQSKFGPEPGRI